MNVAHLLPASVRFPLQKHNGRYEWVLRLASMQVAAGHTVTIYCAPGSSYDASPGIQWSGLPATSSGSNNASQDLLRQAFANPRHEIFHSHLDTLHYAIADATNRPVVFTQHWFPDRSVADAVHLNTSHNVRAVPVTNYMWHEDSKLAIPCVDVIYHGIDLSLFKLSTKPRNDRLLFVGRIAPHKGVSEAVDIALRAGAKLDIMGKINAKDQAYYESFAGKIDGQNIRYLGPKSQADVAIAMRLSRALLFPGEHIEAFGQTIIEAAASGLPVIARDLGANAELIIDTVTGYVVKHSEDFTECIQQIDTIDSYACREHGKQFDINRMVSEYTALYEKLLMR